MVDKREVENWFRDAEPDDAITGTVAGLKRIAMLPTEHRQRFAKQVQDDPTAVRALEELQTAG